MENMYSFFSRLIGTLAVILLIAAYAGSTQLLSKHLDHKKSWKVVLLSGLMGGLFGIYGNISGIDLNGAVISVRDIGIMLAGFIGGPLGGILAGAIAGIQRLTMGGITAPACVVATSFLGLFCGLLSMRFRELVKKFLWALLIGAVMEIFHLSVVLLMVKPFSIALDIVKQIALPFITVNAFGIAMMTGIIHFFENQQKVSREQERLRSELMMANVIQNSLLPALTDKYPGRQEVDVSASMEPAKEVGGDFYDLFFVNSDKIAFLVGDVSGKGVPAALFMASSKNILQNYIRNVPSLSEAVSMTNNLLCRKNDADMFVTLWAGILDLTNGKLTFVNAGHNPPVLLRSGNAEFIKTRPGLVLAGMEETKYRENELQLQDGDVIFLYTDGVTEAIDREEALYGNDRLLDCLSASSEGDARAILENIRNSVNEFVQGNEQFDDITMLCLRWNSPAKAL